MNENRMAWATCYKKRLWWAEADAQAEAMRMYAAHGARLNVYPCNLGTHGEHFHIGHAPDAERIEQLQRLRTFGRHTVLTAGAM
jgi:hypothetical protein